MCAQALIGSPARGPRRMRRVIFARPDMRLGSPVHAPKRARRVTCMPARKGSCSCRRPARAVLRTWVFLFHVNFAHDVNKGENFSKNRVPKQRKQRVRSRKKKFQRASVFFPAEFGIWDFHIGPSTEYRNEAPPLPDPANQFKRGN